MDALDRAFEAIDAQKATMPAFRGDAGVLPPEPKDALDRAFLEIDTGKSREPIEQLALERPPTSIEPTGTARMGALNKEMVESFKAAGQAGPWAIPQAGFGALAGMTGFLDSAVVQAFALAYGVSEATAQKVFKNKKIDWSQVLATVKQAGEERSEKYYQPTDPGAKFVLNALAYMPRGIKTLFDIASDMYSAEGTGTGVDPYTGLPEQKVQANAKAAMQTYGDLAELATFGWLAKGIGGVKHRISQWKESLKKETFQERIAKQQKELEVELTRDTNIAESKVIKEQFAKSMEEFTKSLDALPNEFLGETAPGTFIGEGKTVPVLPLTSETLPAYKQGISEVPLLKQTYSMLFKKSVQDLSLADVQKGLTQIPLAKDLLKKAMDKTVRAESMQGPPVYTQEAPLVEPTTENLMAGEGAVPPPYKSIESVLQGRDPFAIVSKVTDKNIGQVKMAIMGNSDIRFAFEQGFQKGIAAMSRDELQRGLERVLTDKQRMTLAQESGLGRGAEGPLIERIKPASKEAFAESTPIVEPTPVEPPAAISPKISPPMDITPGLVVPGLGTVQKVIKPQKVGEDWISLTKDKKKVLKKRSTVEKALEKAALKKGPPEFMLESGGFQSLFEAAQKFKNRPREYQEKYPEKTVHEDWDLANSPRYELEAAGDVLRELQKRTIDPGYILEKLRRIQMLEGELTGRIHPDDRIAKARKHVPEKLRRLINEYEAQPTTSEPQRIAKEFILSLLREDFKRARMLSDTITNNVALWSKGESSITVESLGFQTIYENLMRRLHNRRRVEAYDPQKHKIIWPFNGGPVVKKRQGGTLKAPLFFPEIKQVQRDIMMNAPEAYKKLVSGAVETATWMFESLGPDLKDVWFRTVKDAEHFATVEKVATDKWHDGLWLGTSKADRVAVGTYATGLQQRGLDMLKAQGVKPIVKLPARLEKIYNTLRLKFDEYYDRLSDARQRSGLPPFPKEPNYFTFIHTLNLMERMGVSPATASVQTYLKMRATAFRFVKPRAKIGGYELELDAKRIFSQYYGPAIKHVHMSPVLSQLRELLGDFDGTFYKVRDKGTGQVYKTYLNKQDAMKHSSEIKGSEVRESKNWSFNEDHPRAADALDEWLNFQTGLPDLIDRGIDKRFGPMVNKGLIGLNNNLTAAVLVGKVRSAAIQVTATLGTYIELGNRAGKLSAERNLAYGISSIFKPQMRKFAVENSKLLLARRSGGYDVHAAAMYDAFTSHKVSEVRNLISRGILKVTLQLLDYETALASWNAAYRQAVMDLNVGHKAATRLADELLESTQISSARSSISPIQRSALGRSVTLWQTFTIGDWNFFLRGVLGIKNKKITKKQAVKNLMRLIAGTTIINTFYEDVLGITSPLSTPIRAARKAIDAGESISWVTMAFLKELAEKVPVVGGPLKFGTDPLGAPAELLGDIAKMVTNYPLKPPWYEVLSKVAGVPGSGQLIQMYNIGERGGTPIAATIGAYPLRAKKLPEL